MIAALLMLAQIAPAPAEPKPIATTIAAIRADPKKFDGRVVRLHGWINNCAPRGCLIEEHRATSGGERGESLSIGADAKFDDVIKPLVPTWVELDARVDATCLGRMTVCANRAPDLTVVQLRGVIDPREAPFKD